MRISTIAVLGLLLIAARAVFADEPTEADENGSTAKPLVVDDENDSTSDVPRFPIISRTLQTATQHFHKFRAAADELTEPLSVAPAATSQATLPLDRPTPLQAAPAIDQLELPNPVSPDAVNEIIRVRRGRSLLRGTLLDTPHSDQAFAGFLERLRLAKVPRTSAAPPSTRLPSSPIDPLFASLRDQCRELDQRAADLEEQGDYQRADHVRALAQVIRQEVRSLVR